jgi:hypothetical protein
VQLKISPSESALHTISHSPEDGDDEKGVLSEVWDRVLFLLLGR